MPPPQMLYGGFYGYPPPYPQYMGYPAATSPDTSMSELKPLSEDSDDDELEENKLKYKMGPLLENVLEDFHRGNEILANDPKVSKGSLLSLTGKSRKH